MKHQGILRVTRALTAEVRIETALPEGHRIIATRDAEGDWPWIEYLIEGPHMPSVDDGQYPATVMMVVRQEAADGKITARFGQWTHQPGIEWPILTA